MGLLDINPLASLLSRYLIKALSRDPPQPNQICSGRSEYRYTSSTPYLSPDQTSKCRKVEQPSIMTGFFVVGGFEAWVLCTNRRTAECRVRCQIASGSACWG